MITGRPIRVLTLWEPWASLMAMEQKRFETRSWETDYRGLVAIHAAKRWNGELRAVINQEPFKSVLTDVGFLPLGNVVAVGDLRNIITTREFVPQMSNAPYEYEFGDYTPGRFAWRFPIMHRLPKPIPWKGSQGFKAAPSELRDLIAAQLPDLHL